MVRHYLKWCIAIRIWHQFAMTAHTCRLVFGVVKKPAIGTFNNDINYTDSTGIDHDKVQFF
jgi:hypothetical protein